MPPIPRTLTTATLAAVLAGAGVGASPAQATSGCTYTAFPHEYVCGNISGKKLRVDSVAVVRGKLSGGAIYDLHGKVWVRTPAGRTIRFNGDTRRGKTFGRQYVTVRVNRSFPHGSRLCARAYERGSFVDATCFTIKR